MVEDESSEKRKQSIALPLLYRRRYQAGQIFSQCRRKGRRSVAPATLTTPTVPGPVLSLPLRLASLPLFPRYITANPQNAPRSPHRPRREAERGQVQHAQFADGRHLQSRWVAHSQPSMPTPIALPTGGTSPRERRKKNKGNSS